MKPNPHRETELSYDTVLIGSSLEALVTAYKYQIPIFCDVDNKPLPYYYIPYELDLSPIQCKNTEERFEYLSGKVEKRGMQCLELWNILSYRMKMMGLMPFEGSYKNNFTDKLPDLEKLRKFEVISKGKTIKISSNKVVLFDYPRYSFGRQLFYINDYINIENRINIPANLFVSRDCDFQETFCYEALFYSRSGNMHGVCAKSIIEESSIDEWKYSATSARMKIEQTIFWNIEKKFKLSLESRDKAPMLTKLSDSIEEIIHLDSMDIEIYE